MQYLKYLLISLLIFVNTIIVAQTTVTGVVYDEITKETMPFVNIYFQGTTVGTVTDIEGKFSISSSNVSDTLMASFIGYDAVKKFIKKGVTQTIDIYLGTKKIALQEVVIKAGENPAYRVVRKIIENKKRNNFEEYDFYETQEYDRMQFDLNNFDEDFTKKKALKGLEFMFENIDSSEYNGKAYVPVFLIEKLSDKFIKKEGLLNKEIVRAQKVHGVNNPSINDFIDALEFKFNIYSDFMVAFNKNLISPISSTWKSHYRYYLRDSLIDENGVKEYKIEFKRRHKSQVAFSGEMLIDGNSYAVKSIKMRLAGDANINFVNDLAIEQYFVKTDSLYSIEKAKMWLDLNLGKGSKGFFGTKITTYSNTLINNERSVDFYSNYTDSSSAGIKTISEKETNKLFEEVRGDKLTKSQEFIIQNSDSINAAPIFRIAEALAHAAVTGYFRSGKFEYGPYPTVYSFNKIEGSRLKFEMKSSKNFSTKYQFSAHLAYGFQDTRLKYGAKTVYFFQRKPHRKILRLEYKNDVEQLGQTSVGFKDDNIFVSLARRNPSIKLTNVEEIKAAYEYEYKPGLSYKITLSNSRLTPLNINGEGLFFETNNNPLAVIEPVKNLFTNEVTLTGIWEHQAKYITGVFRRKRVKQNKYPQLQLDFTYGLKNYLGGNKGAYQKVNLAIVQRVRVKQFGFFDYTVEAGQVFGSLPYPLLKLHDGNEALTFKSSSFNLMNFYEFISDKYASVLFEHHFDGYFLNRIPLIRKLKWREVAVVKSVIGSLDEKKHSQEFLIPATSFELTDPYTEIGFGIENIFKLLRFDAVWRTNYLGNPNADNFGIRGSFKILW